MDLNQVPKVTMELGARHHVRPDGLYTHGQLSIPNGLEDKNVTATEAKSY